MNPILMDKNELIEIMIGREAQRRFTSAEKLREYGDFAWYKGKRAADDCSVKYKKLTPVQLARTLGLTVEDLDGPGFYYSEYHTAGKKIVLFKNTIRDNFIRTEYSDLLTCEYEVIRQLFLAHEIFHHLECSDPDIGITYKQRQVTVFSLGPFKWKTGLRCLSEIAAHSFALRLAGKGIVY
ncbi:hypothetical protein AALB39_17725 [Lachnospiraceae bacterium 54-53]